MQLRCIRKCGKRRWTGGKDKVADQTTPNPSYSGGEKDTKQLFHVKQKSAEQ